MEQFKTDGFSFRYPTMTKPSLEDISFSVKKGEYLLICGSSGSGKTTLLRHLKSCLAPKGAKKGVIYFNGKPLDEVFEREQASKIGFVMQSPDDQIVTDKVWHELAFGLESLGCDKRSMRGRVAEMACYFGIQDWFHRNVAELSGGQKQLLNLASVMAMRPEVLILDEPTSQLDPIAASDFLNTVRRINRELGTTVIITEHRLEDILPHADRVIVMERGRIISDSMPRTTGKVLYEQGSPMLYAMPTSMRVFYDLDCKGDAPLTVREGREWLEGENKKEPIQRSIESPKMEEYTDDPVLSLKEVWFRYQKKSPDVLRGVSLDVKKGTLHAIVGGNGAGKSTTLKAICNICRPYRGSIRVFGKDVRKYKGKELFSGCISMLPQDPKSLFVKGSVLRELSEMTGDKAEIERVTGLCRIEELLDKHPYDLSGGESQRVALAKILLTKPKLLLLDEPTKGMDSFFKRSFAAIIKELTQSGVSCVMVSHDIEFCAEYADRVSMFFDGGIVTTDTPRSFFSQNSFYTTAANRMSRHIFTNAVTAEDIVKLCRINREADL